MSIRMFRKCAPFALAAAFNSYAAAKPPDLPCVSREAVAPQAGGEEVEIVDQNQINAPRQPEQIPIMPIEVIRAKPVATDADPQLIGARRLYLIGERCRREGDYDMAVNCYNETRLLSPKSPYAHKAGQRLREIEARRATEPTLTDAEEQEAPHPMPRRRVAPPPSESLLQPLLAPVDESVLRALEQVLDDMAKPQPRKIIIELEQSQPAPDASEEQEPPAVQKPKVLFVPAPPRDLTIYVEEPETY